MKRRFTFGLLVVFAFYLGCKSSLLSDCQKETFVSAPSCHQTYSAVANHTKGNAEKEKSRGFCECPVSFEELKADTIDFLPKVSYVKNYSFLPPNIFKLGQSQFTLYNVDKGPQLQNQILFLQLNSIKLLI